MLDKPFIIRHIRQAFAETPSPGDSFLQGSFDGCEPAEEIEPFKGKHWRRLDSVFLDKHYDALSFFSAGGFRFFLPAYLIADLNQALATADPLFHLTSGFHTTVIEIPAGGRACTRRSGGSVLLNPKRYGALTFEDYARFRLAVFSREEASAIVAYLRFRRQIDQHAIDTEAIDAALNAFWLARAEQAPSAHDLDRHLLEENAYMAHFSNP